jgi:hypothetical protein
MDMTMARRESPSTDRFYRLSQIDALSGDEYQDFFNRIVALTGIVATPSGSAARRLARLGGSEPDLRAPRRRRPKPA